MSSKKKNFRVSKTRSGAYYAKTDTESSYYNTFKELKDRHQVIFSSLPVTHERTRVSNL